MKKLISLLFMFLLINFNTGSTLNFIENDVGIKILTEHKVTQSIEINIPVINYSLLTCNIPADIPDQDIPQVNRLVMYVKDSIHLNYNIHIPQRIFSKHIIGGNEDSIEEFG